MITNQRFEDRKATFGIFRRRAEVTAAESALKANGFVDSDIAVLYPPHRGPQDFPQRQRSSVGMGAMIGAGVGGLVFLVIGILVNMRAVPLPTLQEQAMLPDQLMVVLALTLGGMILGAGAGALVGIGTPQKASDRYSDYVDSGGILMSVHVDDTTEAHKAKEVLETTGAQDINLLKEGADWKAVYAKVFSHA